MFTIDSGSEPSLVVAAWRYRWLVVTVVAIAVASGLILHLLRPSEPSFQAQATLLIQEPVVTNEVVALQTASEQFVAAQVEIIRSNLVMIEAAAIIAGDGPSMDLDAIGGSIEVVRTPQSPLINIVATHPDPNQAAAWVNGVAEAYRLVNRRQVTQASTSGLDLIDAQLEQIDTRLREVDQQLATLRAEDPDVVAIAEQAGAAIARIAELQPQLAEATDSDQRAEIRAQIADLRSRLEVYLQVQQTTPAGAEGQALQEEQSQLLDRRVQLLTRADQIAVDADLAPDALALLQPATAAVASPAPRPFRVIAVAIALGLFVGLGLAYALATWRRSYAGRLEPERFLGAPLLAEVPDFQEEGLKSPMAVRDAPRSATAEAYRFAASSIEVAARANNVKMLTITSSTLGHGKTTSVVNTALAAAAQGRSVVVVDCDFGNQEATQLLVGATGDSPGITDIVEGVADVSEATMSVSLGNDVLLSLIGRGTQPRLAASALGSDAARRLFSSLRDSYDLVIVDTPPLLQVAYASALVEYADGVVIVIGHRSQVGESQDLVSRLKLIGTPLLGYIYNRSPLRPEMTASEGSMMDILGDSGFTTTGARSRRRGA